MSKHNYSQYSKKRDNTDEIDAVIPEANVEPEITTTHAVVEALEFKMETEIQTQIEPEIMVVTGVVANCAKLNVRAKADASAAVVCVLDVATEVVIDPDKSTKEWFKVSTAAGVDGYCMRKFVNANL